MDQFRTLKGYGRADAQPSHHLRKLVLHTCRALYYLHDTFGLVHTDVRLASIIVKELTGSLSRAISCKLGGFTLLEEACPYIAGGGEFPIWQSPGRGRTCCIWLNRGDSFCDSPLGGTTEAT